MAQGKNDKHQRKGQKKKVIDPLTRKEWFELRAPAPFAAKSFGYTCANKSAGQSISLVIFRESRRQYYGQSCYSDPS